jgi:hypothetical protein
MLTERVDIVAVGINDYDHLPKLSGPSNDVKRIKDLLIENPGTALFSDTQFQGVIDITAQEFRNILLDYAMNRAALNDILIMYFAGHGAPVGNYDFGLCFKDTRLHSDYSTAPSLSVVKFKDIVETLSLFHVDPVIVIDACYSGQTGTRIETTINQMKRDIQAETGSNYALLCSSSKTEVSYESADGGLFSKTLVDIATEGMGHTATDRGKECVTLTELYPAIAQRLEQESFDIKPTLHIGGTLPNFGFVKNTQYNPVVYTFNLGFKRILNIFWNNGNHREYTTEELRLKGGTEQTTYSKLSYLPAWGLIEKPGRGRGRLTQRGIEFIEGRIKIPYEIRKTSEQGRYVALEGTRQVSFSDF